MFVCLLRFAPLSPFSLLVSISLTPSHPCASRHSWNATLCGMKVGSQVAANDIANNATEVNLTKGSLAYEFPSPLPFLCAALPSFSTPAEIPWDKHMYLQGDLLCLLTPWCEVGASTLMYHTTLLHVFLASPPSFPQHNQYKLITPKLIVRSLLLASGSAFWGIPSYGQLVSDVTNFRNEILKFNCSLLWNNRNLLLMLCRLTSSMQWLWRVFFFKLLID